MDKFSETRGYRSTPRSTRSSPRRGTPDTSRNGSISKTQQFLATPDHHNGLLSHGEGIHRRRSSIAMRAAKAVENVARRMSTPSFSIDKIEENLDKEIKEELENSEAKGIRKILQSSCQDILHSKKVLLLIVLLNITDCLLVLAGLILDINYIKGMLNATKQLTKKFTFALKDRFPRIFDHLSPYDIHKFYNVLLTLPYNCNEQMTDTLPVTNFTHSAVSSNITTISNTSETDIGIFTVEDLPSFLTRHHEKHKIETDIAHGFHKASIAILAVLSSLVLLKIFCYGKQLIKRKMEMFDGVIVIASFILDIVFIKGLTVYPLEETVQILAFLMPWRVIRVANSLVMAVLDQAHLQLKMVYKEKKLIEENLEISDDNNRYNKEVVNALRRLCETEGIASYKVLKTICTCESPSKKKKKNGSLKKKITKKVNCLGSGVDRSSCPYGNIPDMNEVTLEHLHRIANKANFKSTFEDVNEASDSDAESGSLLDKNYNEP
ncbi:uncharacterized protein LOC133190048 [Saccostrea echinata]|uniref:uncharacterized protein LOC133190048 n=1 Tax=Saccostrea echinata TaxID=191078 RepID=UPI002A822E77|nr:uncharacterized protein LOC133190048 [Saccostrea echinata]